MNNMKYFFLLVVIFVSIVEITAQNSVSELKSPEEFFGFQPGTDRSLFNYDPLIEYLQMVAEESPRVKMIEIGESPMGAKMYATFFSSEENISNLDRLKHINKELAINQDLSENEINQIHEKLRE